MISSSVLDDETVEEGSRSIRERSTLRPADEDEVKRKVSFQFKKIQNWSKAPKNGPVHSFDSSLSSFFHQNDFLQKELMSREKELELKRAESSQFQAKRESTYPVSRFRPADGD